MGWYLLVLKKYADFSGRARRKEYWMFVLFNMIFLFVAMVFDSILGTNLGGFEYGLFYTLYSLGVLIPSLAVAVRRLHDIGKSGWWLFISLVPLIGGIWLLVLLLMDSQPGLNQYGENPKENIEVSKLPERVPIEKSNYSSANADRTINSSKTNKCRFCGEELEDMAIKCSRCQPD